MFSRTIRRSILDSRTLPSALPPTFLLPCRARYFNSTSQHVEPPPDSAALSDLIAQTGTAGSAIPPSPVKKPILRSVPLPPPKPSTPLTLDASIKEMLPLLAAQPEHYVSIHIHGKPYLVREGDTVRLPFQMPGVVPGDVLRLNRASSIGSRDYTLKGTPYLDERIFRCRARVMGTEAEPMRIKEKTKRRNRKVKTVRSKHKFTILKIAELRVKNLDELREGE
ncbi:related to ribosomal protein YmL49, mitochondrial [Phialocephala subalpina]|uniref:Large ribosomal subunit protein bL21m n=1 Tax=Phialocephala subalpina TaxID=576137 RepID=A0A1L7WN12_9HELO|nr:related to ribosomal protein YmL49, mitochondrial [Phialocephala subalpina]